MSRRTGKISASSDFLSVTQVVELCGVGRTTVGYWIRTKKLRACRTGRNYQVPIQDLIVFLKSTGRKIPEKLLGFCKSKYIFRTIMNCWDFYAGIECGKNCSGCTVKMQNIEPCFIAANYKELYCGKKCFDCRYYQNIFAPRVSFVEQVRHPAAITKGFYFWFVNQAWADLLGKDPIDFVGLGIEEFFAKDFLSLLMSWTKQWDMSGLEKSQRFKAAVKSREKKYKFSAFGLKEPAQAILLIAE